MGALMARKDLLKGLLQPDTSPAPPEARVDVTKPRYGGGAIGAVSKSIADLKSRSIVELDPNDILEAGLRDRLEDDAGEDARLLASIREHGQQVPVLVRPDPDQDGKYRIVYGRRRVLALRDLQLPIKAMIRDLDDEKALIAQGQENTARRDLSFIEKANFARQMVAAGYDRKVACDAISIDKTVISRMLSVVERVPVEVIEFIGSAPGIGRDRWLELAALWERLAPDTEDALAMIAVSDRTGPDRRFEALFAWLKKASEAPKPKSEPHVILGWDGKPLASAATGATAMTLRISRKDGQGFETWLAENLTQIHRDWLKQRGE